MQCDTIPCLFSKISLCIVFIQITISFCNYIYLLMILIFDKFKVISLSFENPFMHIKHLKYNLKIIILKFERPFCLSNVHHSFPKFEKRFILMIKSAKGVEINKQTYFLHIFTHLVQMCFWPFKLQILILCL